MVRPWWKQVLIIMCMNLHDPKLHYMTAVRDKITAFLVFPSSWAACGAGAELPENDNPHSKGIGQQWILRATRVAWGSRTVAHKYAFIKVHPDRLSMHTVCGPIEKHLCTCTSV